MDKSQYKSQFKNLVSNLYDLTISDSIEWESKQLKNKILFSFKGDNESVFETGAYWEFSSCKGWEIKYKSLEIKSPSHLWSGILYSFEYTKIIELIDFLISKKTSGFEPDHQETFDKIVKTNIGISKSSDRSKSINSIIDNIPSEQDLNTNI